VSYYSPDEDPSMIVIDCDHASTGAADDCMVHWGGMQNATLEQVRQDAADTAGWTTAERDGNVIDLSPQCALLENTN
jgi:hypothetical protein